MTSSRRSYDIYLAAHNRFRERLRLRTDIFKTTKSNPGSMEISKTEGLLYFD